MSATTPDSGGPTAATQAQDIGGDAESSSSSPDGERWVLEQWRRARFGNGATADDARARLIDHYLPLARVIAAKLYAGRTVDEIEFDEYLQLARLGLVEAIDRFDSERGVQFNTFASIRMRGAILNGLERLSEHQQQIAWRQRLRVERAQMAAHDEVPDDLQGLFGMLAEVGVGLALGMLLEGTGMIAPADDEAPREQPGYFAHVELEQLRRRVRALVDALPQQERAVIWLHYVQDTPFTQIANELGVTRGRIAQIHRKALETLRKACNTLRTCDVAW